MERKSFTWKDGVWVDGNQPMLGPMSHACSTAPGRFAVSPPISTGIAPGSLNPAQPSA